MLTCQSGQPRRCDSRYFILVVKLYHSFADVKPCYILLTYIYFVVALLQMWEQVHKECLVYCFQLPIFKYISLVVLTFSCYAHAINVIWSLCTCKYVVTFQELCVLVCVCICKLHMCVCVACMHVCAHVCVCLCFNYLFFLTQEPP